MDFTIPLAQAEFVLMLPFPDEESQLTAPFRPFTLTVIIIFFLYRNFFIFKLLFLLF